MERQMWPAELLQELRMTLLLLNASVQLQYLQTFKRCDELSLLLQFIKNNEKAQISALQAKELLARKKRIEEEKFQHALRSAVERAQNIRKKFHSDQTSKGKQTALRDFSETKAVEERNTLPSDTAVSCNAMGSSEVNEISGIVKLRIPSKMNALINEYESKTANKPIQQLRARFIRQLTWDTSHLNGADNVEITQQHLQEVLRMKIQHLTVLLQTKVDSKTLKNALQGDKASKIFPTYQRLEQAKTLSKQLGNQVHGLANRIARRPVLSTVARDHLEKQLAALRECEDTEVDHNEAKMLFSQLQANGALAEESKNQISEKLQSFVADDCYGSSLTLSELEKTCPINIDDVVAREVGQAVYDLLMSTKVKLNESTNTLLSELDRRNVLLICQLADSLVGCKGKRIRSLIDKTQSDIDVC